MGRVERQLQAREATRRAILDAARELFVADGYAQVSMRNIATRVEYSPGAIYGYFPGKDDIFFALAEEGFRILEAAHGDASESDDPLDDLRATAWRLYVFSKEQPQYFALMFLDRHVPRIGRECERFAFLSRFRDRMFARIRQCIEDGLLPPDVDAHVALRLLFAPIFGLVTLAMSQRLAPGEDPDLLVHAAIETMLAGLRAGGARVAARPASHPVASDRPVVQAQPA